MINSSPERRHNIEYTLNPVIINLGGNFSVEIMTLKLIDTSSGLPEYPFRAYVIDGAGVMDMISLDCGPNATVESIKASARLVLRNFRGLDRVLDAMDNEG